MKIVICGSMSFYNQMLTIKGELEAHGHKVIIPQPASKSQFRKIASGEYKDTAELKIKYNFIRRYYESIQIADAVLILNYDKNGIRNYIGGNSFLEIGFAYVLKKKIFLLNDIPEDQAIFQEVVAMKPVILHGDISKIK